MVPGWEGLIYEEILKVNLPTLEESKHTHTLQAVYPCTLNQNNLFNFYSWWKRVEIRERG